MHIANYLLRINIPKRNLDVWGLGKNKNNLSFVAERKTEEPSDCRLISSAGVLHPWPLELQQP